MDERTVPVRHVVHNARIPFMTQIGIDVSGLVGGPIVAEVVFGIPCVGLRANHASLTWIRP